MTELNELLFAAIEKGEKAEVARLLKEGANANSKDSQGRTPLLLAAAQGDTEIIKTLIKNGAKVDAKDENGKLSLTEKGEKWVVPAKILENESEIGGDLHRQILIKTIEYLHENNMFVMATPEPESFDLIAYSVDAKKKFLWYDKNRKAYEIQTTARKDSILANWDKKEKYKVPITWITYDEQIMEEIKKITENKDEYLLIKV